MQLRERIKQILRPAYPVSDSIVHGAPNARALRMTLNLLNELFGWDTGIRRERLEAWLAPGAAAGGFYADAGTGFEFAGAFAGETLCSVVIDDGGLTSGTRIAAC